MNNKFVKRVAAVVIGVAVLSTCAFASKIDSASYDKTKTTLSYNISSTADKISYIAYAATAVESSTAGAVQVGDGYYSLGNIVAVNQIDDNKNGTGNSTVSIDGAKLAGATHVVLMSGDSNGDPVAKTAVLAIDEYAVAAAIQNAGTLEVTINDTKYTDCPNFNVEVTINKAGGAKFTGLKRVYDGVEEAFTSVTGLPTNVTTIGATGGKITLANVYIVGMPKDKDVSKLTIKPEFEYGLEVN